jgi:magnesium chelatase family protein
VTVIGASRLAEVTGWLRGGPAPEVAIPRHEDRPAIGDTAEIRGNRGACLAAEVSAAGGHHLSITGPPESGAPLLAHRVHGLLPRLEKATAQEVTAVYSVAGALDPAAPLVSVPPFSAPHHTSALADMAGGWEAGVLRPGAASLAHRGVLFLDRALDFDPGVLDVLRRPTRDGMITPPRCRVNGFRGQLPARFIVVTASVQCQCATLHSGACTCSQAVRARYAGRLSGLLRDQVSLRAVMTPTSPGEASEPGEATAVIAARVAAARERTALRLAGTPWRVNAEVPQGELLRRFMPEDGGWEPIGRAAGLGLVTDSGAADVLRAAWTIADLNARPRPTRGDCAAALGLRIGDAQ